ncbi:MAG TPA: symmetrical bis(5'-nucleosyl)-tetraphosphatase [Nitrospiraceae bacterium]|nr:symmetrical bis(5'-nucleosyl)-tetraphosphatase [Nitrospiraceae bacterium]
MATYAIGDTQGCLAPLRQLLDRMSFDPQTDRLWLVGDLVNRGPDSLALLRFVRSLGDSVRMVLGNHDLFLLAAAEDIVTLRQKDTIHDVLGAKDRGELIAWLRRQPLHHREGSFLMIHAGLLPQWTIDESVRLAREVESVLAGPDYRSFLHSLFHGPAPQWDSSLRGVEKLVSITRVLTRMRTCTTAGEMSGFSGPLEQTPAGYLPWFRLPHRRQTDVTIVCGHWAALGLHLEPNLLAIDSGCVWGKKLTAVRLEDRQVFQTSCKGGSTTGD